MWPFKRRSEINTREVGTVIFLDLVGRVDGQALKLAIVDQIGEGRPRKFALNFQNATMDLRTAQFIAAFLHNPRRQFKFMFRVVGVHLDSLEVNCQTTLIRNGLETVESERAALWHFE